MRFLLITLICTLSFPLSAKELRVLPLGESLTAFYVSYRKGLYDQMTAAGVQVDFLGKGDGDVTQESHPNVMPFDYDHAGFYGATIRGRIMPWVDENLASYNPDLITLWIGVNDTGWAHGKYQSGQTTRGDMLALLEQIYSITPKAVVVVGTIPTFYDKAEKWSTSADYQGAPKRAKAFNKDLKKLVSEMKSKGMKVSLVDVGSHINDDDYKVGMKDGVHPGQQAYDRVAPIWFEAVQKTGILQ